MGGFEGDELDKRMIKVVELAKKFYVETIKHELKCVFLMPLRVEINRVWNSYL